jgi:carboxymethylenebutenolidase
VSQFETLMARDGHAFRAYIARPAGRARGAVIVVQEIFGLTGHIRRVADSYAHDGYLAVAPALFDRVRRDLVLGDSPAELEAALGYRKQIPTAKAVLDINASAAMARHVGKIALIGYCWGGTLTWVAAGETQLAAAVCYYGGGIGEHLDKLPKCPTLLHFGEHDRSIPPASVERIRQAFPQGLFYLYPGAGHAFNNEDRPQHYNAEAASLARGRTATFLMQHVG